MGGRKVTVAERDYVKEVVARNPRMRQSEIATLIDRDVCTVRKIMHGHYDDLEAKRVAEDRGEVAREPLCESKPPNETGNDGFEAIDIEHKLEDITEGVRTTAVVTVALWELLLPIATDLGVSEDAIKLARSLIKNFKVATVYREECKDAE